MAYWASALFTDHANSPPASLSKNKQTIQTKSDCLFQFCCCCCCCRCCCPLLSVCLCCSLSVCPSVTPCPCPCLFMSANFCQCHCLFMFATLVFRLSHCLFVSAYLYLPLSISVTVCFLSAIFCSFHVLSGCATVCVCRVCF